MTYLRIREQCVLLIDGLGISEPFDMAVLLRAWPEKFGARIELVPAKLGSSLPCGLLVSTGEIHYVCYDATASPLHRTQIICHELGHVALGHTEPVDDSLDKRLGHLEPVAGLEILHRLMPTLSPGLIRRLMGRTVYDAEQERDAELFALLLVAAVARNSTHRSTAVGPTLGRLPGLLACGSRSRC
ncbi:Cinorf13 protein [Alloactinosynnema sp. L-07]|uniref:hypothetical protein n=1 Tax=Alloactinosynnema sp. L-07 TaxID=1653480 RepID=UPI00065EF1B5|nr:hypothetical protein [Alloactinosynnema sp. L-07]CRK59301.1 Cinorf13 protein [Alloactinosynnema sp. L-07]